MTDYNFTIKLHPYGTAPDVGIVEIDPVAHYLRTGEMLDRAPRDKPAPRYKAQVRDGGRVVHLSYFATREEREAAVFAYKLGVRENT